MRPVLGFGSQSDLGIKGATSHVSSQDSAAEHSGHVGQTKRVEVYDVAQTVISITSSFFELSSQ